MEVRRPASDSFCIHCLEPVGEDGYGNSAGLRLCGPCRDALFAVGGRGWIALDAERERGSQPSGHPGALADR
jgi:hypothetical protein